VPRGLNFEIQAIGVEQASRDLEGIAHRMVNAEPAFVEVERILERGEKRLFDRARGRYVRTGATRASLTQPEANGAIREAHGDQLVFGTRIWYAKFLRKPGSRRSGKTKSAILVLAPTERKRARETILEYIRGGDE
jgi:hypothetical protein